MAISVSSSVSSSLSKLSLDCIVSSLTSSNLFYRLIILQKLTKSSNKKKCLCFRAMILKIKRDFWSLVPFNNKVIYFMNSIKSIFPLLSSSIALYIFSAISQLVKILKLAKISLNSRIVKNLFPFVTVQNCQWYPRSSFVERFLKLGRFWSFSTSGGFRFQMFVFFKLEHSIINLNLN